MAGNDVDIREEILKAREYMRNRVAIFPFQIENGHITVQEFIGALKTLPADSVIVHIMENHNDRTCEFVVKSADFNEVKPWIRSPRKKIILIGKEPNGELKYVTETTEFIGETDVL